MKFAKLYILIFWPVFLLLNHSLTGQNSFSAYQNFSEEYQGKLLQIKVDSLLLICKEQDDITSLAQIAHDYARKVWAQDISKAIEYSGIEVSVLQKAGLIDTTYTKALYNQGRFYFINAEYENAMASYEEIISLKNIPLRTAQAHVEMGNCYHMVGDLRRSIDNFEKGIALLKNLGEYHSVRNQLMFLAQAYGSLDDPTSLERQMTLLQEADSLNKYFDTGVQNYRYLMNAFGNVYISEYYYDFKEAHHHYHNILKEALADQDSGYVAVSFNNLSNLYTLEKNDSAGYYADLGLKFVKDQDTKARLYNNKSQYHLNRQAYESALKDIHKALEINLGQSLEMSEAPGNYQLRNSHLKSHALSCLKMKTEILIKLYESFEDAAYLQNALRQVQAADELIGIVLEGTLEPETKLFWRKKASQVYLQGVLIAHLLKNPEKAFYFIEKNKAFLLAQEVIKNKTYNGLPLNVSQNELALKKEMLRLESALIKVTTNEKGTVRDSLFESKLAYKRYYDSINLIYPKYFENKWDLPMLSLDEAQKMLSHKDVIVSYIWNKVDEEKEALIGLIVNGEKAMSFEIKDTEQLNIMLDAYTDLIARPFETKADQDRFRELSFQLYMSLFPTPNLREMIVKKNLYIIPDGLLQSIPFESLVTNQNTGDYLLKSSDVSYLYSKSFEYYNRSIQRKTSDTFIGYSPVSFKDNSLPRLEDSGKELSSIRDVMGDDVKRELTATKQHFLDESSNYKVIHLATHAEGGKNPWIAFAKDKLELHELYTYRNNAELVTLSACNTLLGELAKGEGVISLARGFFYSGAKSVVSSLWNVNDKSTRLIMTDFYANLKSGQTKSVALNNAKRHYLSTHSLSEQSPYYWASFVLVGDAGVLDSSDYSYLYTLIFLAIAILLILVIRKKKNL